MDIFIQKFITEIEFWAELRVPYRHLGTTRRGCDCSGFIVGVLQELGYAKNYRLRKCLPDWNLHKESENYVMEEIGYFADEVQLSDIQTGDILIMRFGRSLSHIGVLVDSVSKMFVHVYSTAGCVRKSTLINSPWTKRLEKVYRLNEQKIQTL